MRNFVKHAACGFIMGLADLVPGISGGTVAFILGIWERLIASIGGLGHSFLQKDRALFLKSLVFLAPILSGIILAIFLFARSIDSLLNSEQERVYLYSLFMGLILGSSLLCLGAIKKWSFFGFLVFLVSFGLAVAMTYVSPATQKAFSYHIPLDLLPAISGSHAKNIDPERKLVTDVARETILAMLAKGILQGDHEVIEAATGSKVRLVTIAGPQKTVPINPWIVFCGAAAVTAMLLPGISGSYLLVILGVYPEVIGNTADFINALKGGSIDQASFIFLSQFALGIALGAAFFSKAIGFLFKRYHDAAMAALAGFVLGSLRSVWPFWTVSFVLDPLKIEKGLKLVSIEPILGQDLLAPLMIVAGGFALVFMLEWVAKRKKTGRKSALSSG